jgi:DNA-directed RNA polymerase alpha subunit
MHALAPAKIPAVDTIENLPRRVRDIATLRGLGYSFREIAREFEVSPQAISLMLSRHRRVLKQLRGAVELHNLSARAVNALGRHGVRTREEAVRRNVLDLLRGERNCGAKTLGEIERWIAEHEATAAETGFIVAG